MIGVILNARSGYVAAHGVATVRRTILDALPEAHIHLLQPHDDISALCRTLLDRGATCIAAAGGDGTVRSVAATLVGTETPLGVIPAGTLNHFARDVGVGRDVPHALWVLSASYVMPVDVATVNDYIFLNNSSIGLYPEMVTLRRRYEKRLGKWRAMIRATILVAGNVRSTTIYLSDGETAESCRTHLVFVGNNEYELNLLHLGQRERLDAGELCCFILELPNQLHLLRYVFRYLRDKEESVRVLRSLRARGLTVQPRERRRIRVSADGEVFHLVPPLRYGVLPRALRVVVPQPPPEESREVRSAAD